MPTNYHHSTRAHSAADPAVIAERVAERQPSAIPALAVPAFLVEQPGVRRACWCGAGTTEAAAERMAAVVARLRHEEVGR